MTRINNLCIYKLQIFCPSKMGIKLDPIYIYIILQSSLDDFQNIAQKHDFTDVSHSQNPQKCTRDIKLLIHTIKPTNALMLKLYFYTQFVITATYFNLS